MCVTLNKDNFFNNITKPMENLLPNIREVWKSIWIDFPEPSIVTPDIYSPKLPSTNIEFTSHFITFSLSYTLLTVIYLCVTSKTDFLGLLLIKTIHFQFWSDDNALHMLTKKLRCHHQLITMIQSDRINCETYQTKWRKKSM